MVWLLGCMIIPCMYRGQCQERHDALNHEIQSLEQDLNLLKQYRDGDCVVDPSPGGQGQILMAK